MNNLLSEDINELNVSESILKKLRNHGINQIGQLCENTRTSLKNFDLFTEDIKEIAIQLQLNGLDLKNRTY